MRKAGFLALICLLFCGAAKAETSLDLASSCKQLRSVTAGAKAKVTILRTFNNGFCWGAFAALQGLSATKWPESDKSLLGFCAPRESTRIQFIQIFVRYLEQRPDEGGVPFAEVAIRALADAFPCSKQATPTGGRPAE